MNRTHLAIQLAEHAIHFVSLKNDIVLNESLVLLDHDSDSSRKELLDKHFSDSSFLKSEFDEITLSWSFKRTTLVPNAVFADSSANSIF